MVQAHEGQHTTVPPADLSLAHTFHTSNSHTFPVQVAALTRMKQSSNPTLMSSVTCASHTPSHTPSQTPHTCLVQVDGGCCADDDEAKRACKELADRLAGVNGKCVFRGTEGSSMGQGSMVNGSTWGGSRREGMGEGWSHSQPFASRERSVAERVRVKERAGRLAGVERKCVFAGVGRWGGAVGADKYGKWIDLAGGRGGSARERMGEGASHSQPFVSRKRSVAEGKGE